jgi:hypothetical protein
MDTKSDDKERIISYLSYLRDVSRKIVSNAGFEKCFLSKNLGYAIQFDELPSVVCNKKTTEENAKSDNDKLKPPNPEDDDEYPIF